GEEDLSVLDRIAGGDGEPHDVVAVSGVDRPVSLTGNSAGFQSAGLSSPPQRYGFLVEHGFSLVGQLRPFSTRGLHAGYAVPVRCGAFLSPKASPPDCEACPVNEKRPAKRRFPPNFFLTQPQLLDQAVVPLNVLLLEIGEQAAALVDH